MRRRKAEGVELSCAGGDVPQRLFAIEIRFNF